MTDDRSPYTTEEWAAISKALIQERAARKQRGLINVDGIVLFSQAEQSEMVSRVVREMRSADG